MSNKEQPLFTYEETYGLKLKLEDVIGTLNDLVDAMLSDAEAGYQAIMHPILKESIDPELRHFPHPWDDMSKDLTEQEKAATAIKEVWFNNDDDPKRTYDFPGIVGCSKETLRLVNHVNETKSIFQKEMLEIKKKYQDASDKSLTLDLQNRAKEWEHLESFNQQFNKAILEIRKRANLSRLCVKHVYRPIHVIDTLGLMRAKYYRKAIRPSRPRTVKVQLEKFQRKVEQGVANQLIRESIEMLKTLPMDALVAKKQKANEVITVNYKLPAADENSKPRWLQTTGVLPIFYLSQPGMLCETELDFSSLDTPYEIRSEDKKKARKESTRWENSPIVKGSDLYREKSLK